jgi:hypothetical protein
MSYASNAQHQTFYGRTPEERERDNQRAEKALFGELIPRRDQIDATMHCKVAGVTYRNDDGRERQDIIRYAGLAQFDAIHLERDHEQATDDNTVRVLVTVGHEMLQIGHLPRETASIVAPQIDHGCKWRGVITRAAGFPTVGVSVMLYRLA